MTALYAGSFDPFTNGHLDVVKEAARIFDNVIICVADNSSKKRCYDASEMAFGIQGMLAVENLTDKVRVILSKDMLTVDTAKAYGAEYLVRGLRSTSDYIYEEEIARFNYLQDPSLRTIYIKAINEISSSTVREMIKYGKSVQDLVPWNILGVIDKV